MAKRRKILFVDGMSDDAILIITDAPASRIKQWCKDYVDEQINGQNTYFDSLKKEYYVKILHDSSVEDNNDDIGVIGYRTVYDLSEFSED